MNDTVKSACRTDAAGQYQSEGLPEGNQFKIQFIPSTANLVGGYYVDIASPVAASAAAAKKIGISTLPGVTFDAQLAAAPTPTPASPQAATPTPLIVKNVSSDCAVVHKHPMDDLYTICWVRSITPTMVAGATHTPDPNQTPTPPPTPCVITVQVDLPDPLCPGGEQHDELRIGWPAAPKVPLILKVGQTYEGKLEVPLKIDAAALPLEVSWFCSTGQISTVTRPIVIGLCDPGGTIRIDGIEYPDGATAELHVLPSTHLPDAPPTAGGVAEDCRIVESRGSAATVPLKEWYWEAWSDPVVMPTPVEPIPPASWEPTADASVLSVPTSTPSSSLYSQSNPVTSNLNGQYGWIASPNRCYFVIISGVRDPAAAGSTLPDAVSPVVGVHKQGAPVDDLDLSYDSTD
jgi:hypothetical protein